MQDLKLLRLIETLSKYENAFSGFETFLIQGRDECKVKFWRHIVSCKGKYTDSRKDREEAFPLIYSKDE